MNAFRTSTMSPLFKARMGGFCWFMCFVTSIYPLLISGRFIVPGDPATTAANLLANETLFRLGTASLLVSTAFYVGATLFVYEVLRPVNRSLSLLAAFFSLVACAVGAISCVFDLVPFILLKGASYVTAAFTVGQLQALALMCLRLRGQANDIALVLFGLHCLGVGYLIFRSIFLPRIIGVLMLTAGICWMTFLLPPVAQSLAPFNMIPGALGEVSLALWLLIKGINVQLWQEIQESFYRAPLSGVASNSLPSDTDGLQLSQ